MVRFQGYPALSALSCSWNSRQAWFCRCSKSPFHRKNEKADAVRCFRVAWLFQHPARSEVDQGHPCLQPRTLSMLRIKSLEFDGTEDSIYHPFDLEGRRHMEYLTLRGEFTDVPIAEIEESFRIEYKLSSSWNRADFEEEVKQETRQH